MKYSFGMNVSQEIIKSSVFVCTRPCTSMVRIHTLFETQRREEEEEKKAVSIDKEEKDEREKEEEEQGCTIRLNRKES